MISNVKLKWGLLASPLLMVAIFVALTLQKNPEKEPRINNVQVPIEATWQRTEAESEPEGSNSSNHGNSEGMGASKSSNFSDRVETSKKESEAALLESPQPSLDESILFLYAAESRFPNGDWSPSGIPFEDVFFESQDGTKIHGWYVARENPRGCVLVAHGNAGSIATRAEWIRILHEQLRLSIFMFDYRGYGRSEGEPTVEGILMDARAARTKLCKLANMSPKELLLMGESLGGAVAVQLASESGARGLILQSTFSSFRDVADYFKPTILGFSAAELVAPSKLNSAVAISKFRGPLLQSHGNRDKTVPIAIGRKLFDAANQPKKWIEIDGRGHNDWLTPEYLQVLDRMIETLD